MIDWEKIDTIFLDMDGTLLDLNFDNHFWLEFVPLRYAEKNALSLQQAKQQLIPQFKRMEGRLEWYCLDYWSEVLALDIVGLKTEIAGLISVLPHVTEFLEQARQSAHQVVLVTNAHRSSLGLKMEKTCLRPFFDAIVCSHDLGYPKEDERFWPMLQQRQAFDKERTLMVDDSVAVLTAAKNYGIRYLLSISKPDSQQPVKQVADFSAIEDFRQILPFQ